MSATRRTRNSPAKLVTRSRRHSPDEAKQLIIERAVEFLWEHSFRDLTVAKLMVGTTLSRPAFYQYFDDLQGLAESLLIEIEAVMRKTANPWIDGKGEPIAALRVALDGIVKSCVEHGPIIRAVAEAAPLDERLERAWSAFMGRWDESVANRIKAQQREGRVDPLLDARRTAKALNAMDASVLLAEFGHRPQGDPVAALDSLHRIWVGTLYGSFPKRVRAPRRTNSDHSNKKRGSTATS